MRILVIKLGALGDVVLAFQAFADIRVHHRAASITLLTTAPFARLLQASPWFDHVEIDHRPPAWNLHGLVRLRRQLRGFDLVYDLQTSARSRQYFRLAGRPAWSGIAPGASLRHANPTRNAMHTLDRQREQLAVAGVPASPAAATQWLTRHAAHIASPYALLVPGAAPHRPAKRWPAERFGEIGALLQSRGIRPVVAGSEAERPLAADIQAGCPSTIDMTGRTSLPELASLASHAMIAIGNDTGPMHLAAAVGCRCIVLFSADSNPALTAPRSRQPGWVTVLRADDLANLPVARVAAALP